MDEPLVTREEQRSLRDELPLEVSSSYELLMRFIVRWSERVGSPLLRAPADMAYRGLRPPLQSTIVKALSWFERYDGFTRTKLLLLEFEVVPPELGDRDEDVRLAKTLLARDCVSFVDDIELVMYSAVGAYAMWFGDRWTTTQLELRMGGTATMRRKLGELPSLLFDCVKEARDAQMLHLLHHFGVIAREPPLYDYPERAPEGYVPPEP